MAALSQVPGLKILFGTIAGLAIIAIARVWSVDEGWTIVCGLAVVVFSLLLLVLAKFSGTRASEFRKPAWVLLWFSITLFMSWCLLLTSCVFFRWPISVGMLPLSPKAMQQTSLLVGNSVSDNAPKSAPRPNESSISDKADKPAPQPRDFLSPDYMRLFGAVEVPLLMEMLGKQIDFIEVPALGAFVPQLGIDARYYHFSRQSREPVSIRMRNFWEQKWRYRDALPIRNNLWEQFAGKKQAGVDILYSALSPTVSDVISFAMQPEADNGTDLIEEVCEKFRIPYNDQWAKTPPGTDSKNVAYLFVILENTSGKMLTDVAMQFHEYSNKLEIRHFEPKNISSTCALNWGEPSKIALTDAQIQNVRNAPSLEMKIASIAPNQSFLWLLGVYRADDDGFPLFYLTKVQVPSRLLATIDGVREEQPIRGPYLRNAARIAVPDGWFGQ